MKITIEVGQDPELRKQILEIVATQIKKITGDEIRDMVKSHLSQINIAGKVAASIKDTLNQQIDMAIRGYGGLLIQQLLDGRLKIWLEEKGVIEERIKKNVSKLISDAVNNKFIDALKEVISKE